MLGLAVIATLAVSLSGGASVKAMEISISSDVKLERDYDEPFIIKSGAKVNLDLNGKSIIANDADAILVEKGATLVINGNGSVRSAKAEKASLRNDGGNVTLNGGNFVKGAGAEWYVIANFGGKMTVNNGVIVRRDDYTSYNIISSLVINGYHDHAEMIVNGGLFIGGNAGIKNDEGGILTVNDCSITETTNGSIQNWNIATINGGRFNNHAMDRGVIHVGEYTSTLGSIGQTVINGGDFTGGYLFEGYWNWKGGIVNGTKIPMYPISKPAEISGGSFNVGKMVVPGLDFGEAINNSVITGGTFTNDIIEPATGYDKYTDADGKIVVLPTINFDTTDVKVDLTEGDSYQLGLSVDVLKYGVVKIDDDQIINYADGKITAIKVGKTKLTVTLNGQVKTYDIVVTAKPAEPKPETDGDKGSNTIETSNQKDVIVSVPNTGASATESKSAVSSLVAMIIGVIANVLVLAGARLFSKQQ